MVRCDSIVADALVPPVDVPVTGTEIAIRLDQAMQDALVPLAYGHRVAAKIPEGKKDLAARYSDALQVLQDELVDEIRSQSPPGASLPHEIESLTTGARPRVMDRFELEDAVTTAVALASTNILRPYEIEVGAASTEAIPDFFVDLGFSSGLGRKVRDAVDEVQALFETFQLSAKGRIALAAAGIALIAAAPISLATMGTAAGAAAITSGLAAVGPGGMVGGLITLGGLASTGAVVTTTAATLKSGATSRLDDPAALAILVASSLALKKVGAQLDPKLWDTLTQAEGIVSARINKLSEFSDAKSPHLQQLLQSRDAISRLMRFAHDNGLGLSAIEE
ncbi:hypothetical protein AB0P16_05015 [Dietzia maris]|uniref:hypothetical protein n=1 Tax=Dietzia maris TaxID=37915 RepID=UPI0034372F70